MKVKSIIILACMILSCNIGAKAQDYEYPKHEIAVGYGLCGMTDIASIFGDIFAGAFTGGVDEIDTSGEISAQYLYNFNKTWGVGGVATYSCTTAYNKDRTSKQSSNFVALMPTVRANWFHKKHFGMYSRVAVGGVLNISTTTNYDNANNAKDSDNTDATIAFQIAPIGMEFGSNKISGFFEAGFGMQGIFMAGVRLGL